MSSENLCEDCKNRVVVKFIAAAQGPEEPEPTTESHCRLKLPGFLFLPAKRVLECSEFRRCYPIEQKEVE